MMLRDNPTRGVGYGNWRPAVQLYAPRVPELVLEEALLGHAHNSYLTVACETGAIGFLPLLSLWLALIAEHY